MKACAGRGFALTLSPRRGDSSYSLSLEGEGGGEGVGVANQAG